jgi:hypothetical protein
MSCHPTSPVGRGASRASEEMYSSKLLLTTKLCTELTSRYYDFSWACFCRDGAVSTAFSETQIPSSEPWRPEVTWCKTQIT